MRTYVYILFFTCVFLIIIVIVIVRTCRKRVFVNRTTRIKFKNSKKQPSEPRRQSAGKRKYNISNGKIVEREPLESLKRRQIYLRVYAANDKKNTTADATTTKSGIGGHVIRTNTRRTEVKIVARGGGGRRCDTDSRGAKKSPLPAPHQS
uniref:Uncharacterized protein n=1 Tax=Schizaphis graminum TaxID=13262 RepID=A0A2S2N872_SCHGA